MKRSGFHSTIAAGIGCGFLLLISTSNAAQESAKSNYEGNPLAIVDVTIIDVSIGAAKPHQVVVIRHGKIDHIKAAAEFKTPGWMIEVGGKGKFLIPGLWDAHVHLSFWDEPDTEDESPDTGSNPDSLREPLGRLHRRFRA